MLGAPPARSPQPKPDANRLADAYQKLVPEIKRRTEDPSLREPFTRLAKEFQEAIKSQKLVEAQRALDLIEEMLAAPPPADGLGKEFANRYFALKPRLEQAIRENRGDTGKMRAGVQFAVETASEKQYDRALKALDQIEKLLEAADAAPGTATQPGGGLVAYRKTLLEFDSAKKTVFANIDALKKKIPSEMPDEADFADMLAEELHDVLEEIDDAVIDAMNAAQDEAAPVNAVVKARLANAVTKVESSPLVKHVDSNPFGVSTAIESTLTAAFSKVDKAMPVVG
jgi:hypothetical protein